MSNLTNQKNGGMTREEHRKYYSMKGQRARAKRLKHKISKCERAILDYLKQNGGMFYGSQKDMAKEIGYSRQHMNTKINTLVEKSKVLILKSNINKLKRRVVLVEVAND